MSYRYRLNVADTLIELTGALNTKQALLAQAVVPITCGRKFESRLGQTLCMVDIHTIVLIDNKNVHCSAAHCPKSNLNLCINTENVTVGADATVYVWFLCRIYVNKPLHLFHPWPDPRFYAKILIICWNSVHTCRKNQQFWVQLLTSSACIFLCCKI